MLFELRQYRTKPGQRERWVQLMEEVIIPFQVEKGVVIVGSFVGEDVGGHFKSGQAGPGQNRPVIQ